MSAVTQVKPSLTERINRIEISATLAVVNEADRMRQAGADLVDFGAGEPHFHTPQHIKDAAIAAIPSRDGHLTTAFWSILRTCRMPPSWAPCLAATAKSEGWIQSRRLGEIRSPIPTPSRSRA